MSACCGHGLSAGRGRFRGMLHFPSCSNVFAFGLTVGFFGLAQVAPAQISPATETAHTDEQGRRIAPHDTFYTTEYVSVRTDKGVEGFPPGTEVKLVSVNREAHTLTVTDGHANVELPPDKLTNDMDIAALVQAKDNANQEKIAEYHRKQAEAYQKYQKEVADYTAKDLEKREQEIRDANTRAQEQTNASQSAQPVNTNASYSGYYNQGGNGYGSPYGYFIDLNSPVVVNGKTPAMNTTNQTGGGRGAVSSSQNTNQGTGTRSGGTTTQSTGTTSTGSTGAGGKKP